jgi:ATP/maltotriose-dependent transcriptional regulator MalT
MSSMTRERAATTSRVAPDPSPVPLLSDVPPPPRAVVERQRLTLRLEAAAEKPLTLVSAQAGSGKTVSVASWVLGRDPRDSTAWVTLDERSAHPAVLWPQVVESFGRLGVALPDGLYAASLRDHTLALAALVAGLHRRAEPLTLVLDDFELAGPDLCADIEFLLRRSGSWLRLVIVSREDPAIPLDRLRRSQAIAELRTADLAFTEEETERLVRASGIRLTGSSIESLRRSTRGWAAGLRFAITYLSCCHRPDDAVRDLPGHSWLSSDPGANGAVIAQQRALHITWDIDASTAAGQVIEPLTPKEREVLVHLSALLSTEEIASAMFVSVNTVRTHVRSILRKLAVSRRNDAVRRARAMHLISP